MYTRTERQLRGLSARLPARPRAVLVISAHWEAANFSVATGASPGMEYDYAGFPAHTYQISYPAPGDPMLAKQALVRVPGHDGQYSGLMADSVPE
jgi:aromatic ring-opening dioxygenase catalytic subunit (LigB family)